MNIKNWGFVPFLSCSWSWFQLWKVFKTYRKWQWLINMLSIHMLNDFLDCLYQLYQDWKRANLALNFGMPYSTMPKAWLSIQLSIPHETDWQTQSSGPEYYTLHLEIGLCHTQTLREFRLAVASPPLQSSALELPRVVCSPPPPNHHHPLV